MNTQIVDVPGTIALFLFLFRSLLKNKNGINSHCSWHATSGTWSWPTSSFVGRLPRQNGERLKELAVAATTSGRWWQTWVWNSGLNRCRDSGDWYKPSGTHLTRTSGQTSIGFQDEFYYNRSIKQYKGCVQVPSKILKAKPEIRVKLETDESRVLNTT